MIVPTYETTTKEQELIISRLQQENKELKEKQNYDLKWALKCDELHKENQELKKQLEETDRKLFLTKHELDMRKKTIDNKLNQQKEFIEYMNKTIEELESDDVDDEEMKGYLIQRIYTFKEILSKYKEIIGGKDE